mmetsp:Transcript_29707/g.73601  ORF Transcript_29707/g.73601 Transcript_29707/m.73601 type:complete len:282 (-) Transcript_29707:12-857(-)
MMWKSSSRPLGMLGRCTFSATSFPPSRSVARYTCPREAAAIGDGVIIANISSSGRPSSVSTHSNASASLNVGSASCREVSSSRYCAGSRSGRVESAWPTLTNAGPSVVSFSRSWFARTLAFSSNFPCWLSSTTSRKKPPSEELICSTRSSTVTGCLLYFAAARVGLYSLGAVLRARARRCCSVMGTTPSPTPMDEDFGRYPSPEEAAQAPVSASPEEEAPPAPRSGSTGAAGGAAVATRTVTLAPRCDSRGRSVVRAEEEAEEEEGDSPPPAPAPAEDAWL